jgi:membrane-associated phospholipid phosphatase
MRQVQRFSRSSRIATRALCHAAVLVSVVVHIVPAQSKGRPKMSPADSAYAARPLFGVRDAVIAASFVGGTILLFPFDARMADYLQDEETRANKFFGNAATGFEVIASPGSYVIGAGMYIIGRVGNYGRLQDLGLHGTEAVVVGDLVTGALKGLAGRSRPFVSNDTNPRDFKFGAGITNSDRQSFPSGHTTSAFAAAAAVTAETGRWWPGSTKFIGPLMYGGATMVGLSRMYHNKHWASDVALGAAIGTFAGQKVAQYNHSHPDDFIDRALLHISLAPDGNGGAMLGWTAAW